MPKINVHQLSAIAQADYANSCAVYCVYKKLRELSDTRLATRFEDGCKLIAPLTLTQLHQLLARIQARNSCANSNYDDLKAFEAAIREAIRLSI